MKQNEVCIYTMYFYSTRCLLIMAALKRKAIPNTITDSLLHPPPLINCKVSIEFA